MSRHVPGHFKQSNKPFKGKSKGAVKRRAGAGRRETPKGQTRKVRQNAQSLKQRRIQKNELVKQQRELNRNRHGPPRLIVLLPMSDSADCTFVRDQMIEGSDGAESVDRSTYITAIECKQFKAKFNIVTCSTVSLFDTLDIFNAADLVVPVIDARDGYQPSGLSLISILKSQGVPSVLPCVTGLQHMKAADQKAALKGLLVDSQFLLPTVVRVLPLLKPAADRKQLLRFCAVQRLNVPVFRSKRAFVFADGAQFVANGGSSSEYGTLQVSGYVRGGGTLSSNLLVHVPGFGDFQIGAIRTSAAPDHVVLDAPTEERESLVQEHIPDPFADGGEQTWPTADDYAMAGDMDMDMGQFEEKHVEPTKLVKVPKGTSEYQAAWLVPEVMEGASEENDDEETGAGGDAMMEQQDPEDFQMLQAEEGEEEGEEEEQFEAPDLKHMEEDEMHFPDEVAVGEDVLAREKYYHYRGLKSFRTSVWDAKEGLPVDYGRIFQFENFKQQLKMYNRAAENGVAAGVHVIVEVINFPAKFAALLDAQRPLLLGGLLPHERKMSVLHCNLTKMNDYDEPVPSKDNLVFSLGWRRLRVRPLFSQRVSNSDRSKYERFLHADRSSVASFFAPITYTPCPLAVFKEGANNAFNLVATGSLDSIDADRLIIKQCVLTGYPVKIGKHNAMIKGMFHNPEDISWFSPIDLWTKCGRVGHIKESHGTHGEMLCVFDQQLASHDTVCMSLYRRVFPKWENTEEILRAPQ